MGLTFHFLKPRDLLEKLNRDRVRLEAAVSSWNVQDIADSLFDFANTAYCIKDWLKENSNERFSQQDVEKHVNALSVLSACRDICNANKHFIVTKYVPTTEDVYVSASETTTIAMPELSWGFQLESFQTPAFKVKVLLANGNKFEVADFARQAVDAWEDFFTKHGL